MSETVTVLCDQCGKDLSYHLSSYPGEYVITLAAKRKPRPPDYKGGMVFAVIDYPPLDRTYHFCNLACLREHLAASSGGEEAAATSGGSQT